MPRRAKGEPSYNISVAPVASPETTRVTRATRVTITTLTAMKYQFAAGLTV